MENLSPQQQRQLMQQATEGPADQRRAALERLLAAFRGPSLAVIHQTLARVGVGPDHAEEALQAAYLRFISRGLRQYDGRAAPWSYFARIAINAALDICRRHQRQAPEPDQAAVPWQPPVDHQLEQTLADLRRCLEQLPAGRRQAIQLYYLQGAGTLAVCSEQLGISSAALAQRLSRARRDLADCMARATEQPPQGGKP